MLIREYDIFDDLEVFLKNDRGIERKDIKKSSYGMHILKGLRQHFYNLIKSYIYLLTELN